MTVIYRITAVALALAVIAATGLLEDDATAVAGLHPQIHAAVAFRAPIGMQGEIESPYVGCTNDKVAPKVRWVLTNTGSGKSHTYRWRGAYPGAYFPRVPVGKYKSRTTAWCRTIKDVRRQSLTVKEKTPKTTISPAEFRKVRRGMSRASVSRIVGFAGRFGGSYAGKTLRIYDMMPFWRWAIVTYRNGRVVGKMWNVAHD